MLASPVVEHRLSVLGLQQLRLPGLGVVAYRFSCSMTCRIFLAAAAAKSLQSCLTLCDPIDGSLPGSPVPRILQAGTLEWVAISFSNA